MKKRIFSMITTLVVIFGLAGVIPMDAFAYETYYYDLEIGENGIYTSDGYTTYYYEYTPAYSGAFYFETSAYESVYIKSPASAHLTPIANSQRCQYNLQAGNTYYFYFTNDYDDCRYYSMDFYEVYYNKLGFLYLGNSVVSVNDSVYDQNYYYFSVPVSGMYRITSNNPFSDPMVLVTDVNNNIYYYFDDEGGSDGANYSATMMLYSNRSYFFSFYDYGNAYVNNITIIPIIPSMPPTTAKPTTPKKTTRSASVVAREKTAAKKAMKQAKITKLTVKSKSKKKITVTWKKVKKAKGYQVQASTSKKFKKIIFNKNSKKTKLTIKNKKIKSQKTYYVRVRAYAIYKDINNKAVKVYSKWNKKTRKVKVK